MKMYYFILTLFFCSISFAQSTISGSVKDSKNEPIPGANITIVGDTAGTVSDANGDFTLKTSKNPPFSIEISSVGFGTKSVQVTSNSQKVNAVLVSEDTQLDEIVVSASRAPERVRESPVTIERMTTKDIKKTASPTFYDGLENLKEVHMNTSSMSFKSINTRGFATVANTRFMQLVDGMDNSSPLLNFVLGNLIGISELDVQNVELLPGASSALYGANAFNGILFMNSKSPFTNPGISAYVKYGQTHQNAAGTNDYYDYGIRAATVFTPHFAAKANFTFLKATDWYATNYDEYRRGVVTGQTRADYSYDGLNVYGDEAALNLKSRQVFGSTGYNILPNDIISRTGYNETDLTENKVRNAKIDFSLHFKPWANTEKFSDIEIIWQSKFGFGNSVYQGASRYNLNGFFMQQHKLELKGKNFFLRGYMTGEDGGKSYDMTFTALNINRTWKSDQAWFQQYGSAYVLSTLGGQTPEGAHAIARNYADYNIAPNPSTGIVLPPNAALGGGQPRFMPGTPEFIAAFNTVTSNPDVLSGSKLVDNSKIYHSDGNYNFRDLIKVAEIQVGGSYRLYDLNSHGRIFTDDIDPIEYDEYGIYTQIQKKIAQDKLKLTGSLRYDKAKNFDGSISPRISVVFTPDANKNHNFRASFQTGFRNPTTQDQYIGFDIGSRVLLGSAPDNLGRFSEVRGNNINGSGTISAFGQAQLGSTTKTLTGDEAYYNSFTEESFFRFDAAYRSGPPSGLGAAATLLEKANPELVKPEQVKAFELGYRGNMKGFSIDLNGYYNIYDDCIGGYNVVTPYYGIAATNPDILTNNSARALAERDFRTYQIYTNTDAQITSLGFGVGLTKKLGRNFEFAANYNYAEFDFNQEEDPSFEASFNTPKHRVKASISNDNLFKNFGFNISGRWSDEYFWQSTFADGMIDAATVVDAQINYNIPCIKSILKVGATNIGGKEYYQVLGAGAIGQQYFASLTINP